MLKKTIAGVTVAALIGGYVYTSEQKLNDLEEKNDKLEIKIQQLNKNLDGKAKDFKKAKKELETKQKQIEELEKEKEKLKKNLGRAQDFVLTFYTSLPEENGGYTVTCQGKKLKNGMVASNVYPLGTKIRINGKIFTVSDRGGKNFNHSNRLDVLVEKNSGESNSEYLKRVNNLGKVKVTGYILED